VVPAGTGPGRGFAVAGFDAEWRGAGAGAGVVAGSVVRGARHPGLSHAARARRTIRTSACALLFFIALRRSCLLATERQRPDEDADGDREHGDVPHQRAGASGDRDGREGSEVPGRQLHLVSSEFAFRVGSAG
jgi:hypothetical protein